MSYNVPLRNSAVFLNNFNYSENGHKTNLITDFDIGERVYFIRDNRPTVGIIKGIRVEVYASSEACIITQLHSKDFLFSPVLVKPLDRVGLRYKIQLDLIEKTWVLEDGLWVLREVRDIPPLDLSQAFHSLEDLRTVLFQIEKETQT